jgi:hypothetical protein
MEFMGNYYTKNDDLKLSISFFDDLKLSISFFDDLELHDDFQIEKTNDLELHDDFQIEKTNDLELHDDLKSTDIILIPNLTTPEDVVENVSKDYDLSKIYNHLENNMNDFNFKYTPTDSPPDAFELEIERYKIEQDLNDAFEFKFDDDNSEISHIDFMFEMDDENDQEL